MSISVLISVYISEVPQHLNRALQSIWTDQTLKPDEVILIEDGILGDELQSVVFKWKKILGEKLIIHSNPQNIGLTKSLNIGLKYATGDFIARMDSDDISMPYRFERQVAFFKLHPDISVLGGALQEFSEDNDCICIRTYPKNSISVKKYIVKANPLAHPAVMMKSSIFKQGIVYDERYRTSQDVALWFDLVSEGFNIANLPDVLLKFRASDTMFSRRSRHYAKNEFLIWMRGIHKLYGIFTPYYIYPVLRLVFRLMPVSIIKFIYSSNLRSKSLNK